MKSQEKNRPPVYGRLKNFIIDQDLDRRLSEVAAKENSSVSALIRRCCRESLEAREHDCGESNN